MAAYLSRMRQSFGTTFSFFTDSWSELKKVKWPTRKELTSYTIVVVITVALVTVYFAGLDLIISQLLRLVFE